MHEDEVLAARLADESRIADVAVEIGAGLHPKTLERGRGAGEVDAGEVARLRGHLADEGAAAGQEVDDAVGQSGLAVELHQVVVGEQGRGRRFPDGHVAHQHGRHAEVGGDAGEVKRRDGQDEALERTILRVVELHGAVLGLHRVDLRGVVDVVAEEVDGLAG